ncbi:hypothetical protein BKA67DRAFT_406659 [Truncatella angustata]|uniref:Zn(2)-C6 fungal-type domain-containing protein n=1 Tax=Truncatella angustata TaxID=152316 RepID=A0A9P8ZUL0_9PEZI|nr:uncharacterized protein BKA67DRAFT_406659 [Truncatella angustata]KAH6648124.1 hypothetical protein BKA67DRAFT_406659 [Truncatella angustata]
MPSSSRPLPGQGSGPPTRKKFATPPVKLACMPCRGSRVRCSGSQPCHRCGARGLQCSYSQSRRGVSARSATDDRATKEHDSNSTVHGHPVSSSTPNLILPPLYLGNGLESVAFDETQSDGLDEFFSSLFATPSYPQPPLPDHHDASPSMVYRNFHALRRYQRDADVLDSYYALIHASFPILPLLSKSNREHPSVSDQPMFGLPVDEGFFADYQPSSPLILALLSVLVLFPDTDGGSTSEEISQEMRFRFTQSLAECASESIEVYTSRAELNSLLLEPDQPDSWLHPNLPNQLQIPMALCVLSMQAYLHSGNLPKMLHLAERALDTCMQMSLHQYEGEGPQTETIRRVWWMSYLCLCNACIVNCKPPKQLDRSSIKTPYPDDGLSQVWKQHLVMHNVTAVRLASAKIKLHRYCAFMNSCALLEVFEHIPEEQVDTASSNYSLALPLKLGSLNGSPRDLRSFLFPFTEAQSLETCTNCALEIITHLEAIRNHVNVPYFFCSSVQCAYTIMMVYFSQTRPGQTSSGHSQNDLGEQCLRGLDRALVILQSFASSYGSIAKVHDLVRNVGDALMGKR